MQDLPPNNAHAPDYQKVILIIQGYLRRVIVSHNLLYVLKKHFYDII